MRLRQLLLDRYGHLSNTDIIFSDAPDFHIVVGPNEAGKSTALSAIGDALFRFPHKTNYDFLHGTRGLRVGVEIQARDGRQAVFFRRKGRKGDLYNSDDQPVPEAAIAAFLGGATRERFDSIFGLNGAMLRDGGHAILEGKGDAGSAIMSAYAGVHDYRRLAQKLEEDAGRLYGDKRGQRRFHVAAELYTSSKQALNERRIDPEAWKTATAERDRLEQLLADNATRAAELQAERSRLDRSRRTTPFCRRILVLVQERDNLDPVPDLPEDAQTQFSEAMASRAEVARDLEREGASLKAVESGLDSLPPDDFVLAQAEAVDALAANRTRIVEAMHDRELQRTIADQNEALIQEEGSQLGLSLDADTIIAKRPSNLDRERVGQALTTYDRLEVRHATAATRLEETIAAFNDANAVVEAMPVAALPIALQQVIDRVKAEGRLDTELAEATKALESARRESHRFFSELPLWDRNIAALSDLPLPLTSEIERISALLNQHQQILAKCEGQLGEHDREIEKLDAEIAADAVAGELPTEIAVLAARQLRDVAWTLIRRAHLEGGPAIADQERAEVNLGTNTADGFESLIHAADSVSDRRAREQERVAAAEHRTRRRAERQELRSKEETRCVQAVDRLKEAETAWSFLWQPTGLQPVAPLAMKEWLGKRQVVLGHHTAEQAAARRHADIVLRHTTAVTDLTEALAPDTTRLPTLATQLKHAEVICGALNSQATAKEAALKDVQRAEANQKKALEDASKVDAELAAWQLGWAEMTGSLALAPGTPPGLGRIALQHWNRIDVAGKARQAALDRVNQMTGAIDGFAAKTEQAVSFAAPDLAERPSLEAARLLVDRLAEARRAKQEREQLNQQRRTIETAILKYEELNDAILEALTSLHQLANAHDEEELRSTLSRWGRLRVIAAAIAEEEAELHRLDDGKTLAELMTDASGVDFDAIPARITAIETELKAIEGDDRAMIERRLRVRDELAEMEKGRDAAAAAQTMETALADIDDVVLRYPPIRMAHVLLKAGIERFRRQQQGPLLLRASALFADLTAGRYTRLEVDEDESGAIYVIARRPDGGECRADRLSEGTLDQLYLALRLAAIETEFANGEPLPFIGDDLLVNFDDNRAKAALQVLSRFSRTTQVILFTHHEHIAGMANPGLASVHRLNATAQGS